MHDQFLFPESTSSRETVGNEGEIESNLSQHTVQVFVEEPNVGGRSGRISSQSSDQSQEGTMQYNIIHNDIIRHAL